MAASRIPNIVHIIILPSTMIRVINFGARSATIDLPAGNVAMTGQGRLFLAQNVEKSSATNLGNMTILQQFNI